MGALVHLARLERIAQLTLNRPDAYNALDLPTARELSATLLPLATDAAVHGVVITGTGKAFSAGGDIRRAMAVRISAPIVA